MQTMMLFPNLFYLDLTGCGLVRLPENIGARLRNLNTLVVSWNSLRALPESITQLQRLEGLICSENDLMALPHDMTPLLPSIILIDFSGNRALPPQLQHRAREEADIAVLFEHARRFSRRARARAVALQLLCIRRYRRSELLNGFPRELVALVARALVADAADDPAWDF
jgi:hypothetical protein